MHFSLSALVVLSGFAVQVFGQGPTINSPPQLIQCQPSLLAFDGGVPPYFLVRLPVPNNANSTTDSDGCTFFTERFTGKSALRRAYPQSPESTGAGNVHVDP